MFCTRAGKIIGSAAALLAALCMGEVRAAPAEKPLAAVVGQASFAAKLLATFDSGLKSPRSIAFTPDGKRIIINDDTGASLVWDAARRRRVTFMPRPKRARNRRLFILYLLPSCRRTAGRVSLFLPAIVSSCRIAARAGGACFPYGTAQCRRSRLRRMVAGCLWRLLRAAARDRTKGKARFMSLTPKPGIQRVLWRRARTVLTSSPSVIEAG